MQISPGRLRPSERPVSGSTTLSSALRTTVPHDPGLAGDGSLANAGHMDSTGPASVIPYPCSQSPRPTAVRNLRITSGSTKIPGKTELGFGRVAVPRWVVVGGTGGSDAVIVEGWVPGAVMVFGPRTTPRLHVAIGQHECQGLRRVRPGVGTL